MRRKYSGSFPQVFQVSDLDDVLIELPRMLEKHAVCLFQLLLLSICEFSFMPSQRTSDIE